MLRLMFLLFFFVLCPSLAWAGQAYNPTGGGGTSSATIINYVGKNSLSQYASDNGFVVPSSNSETDTKNIQSWLNSIYVQYTNLDPTQSKQDNFRVSCIEGVIPKTSNIATTSPLIIPNGVCLNSYTQFVRKGSSGTITNNYTGDPTTKALANVQQPTFIFVPGSHNIGRLSLIANSVGTDGGTGTAWGRTWQMHDITAVAGGSGYTNGDTCTTAVGDVKSPFQGATFIITTTAGAVTGTTFQNTNRWTATNGVYPFPILMQQAIWTTANGWTGTRQVFDGSGNYLINCNAGGTGATVSANMWPDWCDGTSTPATCTASTTYHGEFSNYSAVTTFMGDVMVTQSRPAISASYGPTIGNIVDSYDFRGDEIYSEGAQVGLQLTGSDFFANRINDVNSIQEMVVPAGGNFNSANVVLNAGPSTATSLIMDNVSQAYLFGHIFVQPFSTPTMTGAPILLGSNSSSTTTENDIMMLKFNLTNASSVAGVPAISCAYTRNSQIDLVVSNSDRNGSPYPGQNTSFASFGTGCETSNQITGQIDRVAVANMFSGTVPSAGIKVWNAQAGQFVTSGAEKIDSVNVVAATGYQINGLNGISYPTVDSTANGTIAIGPNALVTIGTASAAYNATAVGYQALGGSGAGVYSGTNNTAMGFEAGRVITTGGNNTIVGDQAGIAITTSGGNTIVGQNACSLISTQGSACTALGVNAGASAVSQHGVYVGGNAGQFIGGGAENTAVGFSSLLGSTSNKISGADNTAVGSNSLLAAITTAADNTSIGYQTGLLLTTGTNNTILGSKVGSTVLTTGTNNLLLGTTNTITVSAAGATGEIHVGTSGGDSIKVTGSATPTTEVVTLNGVITLPNVTTGTNADFVCMSAGNVLTLQTSACTISQRKLKENIQFMSEEDAESDLMALRSVSFNMKPTIPANVDPNATKDQFGFIADDVANVDSRLSIYEDDMTTPKSYRQEAIISLLVKVVQHQHEQIQEIKYEIGGHRCYGFFWCRDK